MSAKEMFEALEYKLICWNTNFKVKREYQFIYENDEGRWIEFRKDRLGNCMYIRFDKLFGTITNNRLSLSELKAINQQCKELGWLDE